MSYLNSILFMIFTASAVAAPLNGDTPLLLSKRQTTYTCTITGTYNQDQSTTIGTPGAGALNGFGSSGGMSIDMYGSDGSKKSLWSDSSANAISGAGQTIPTSSTGLTADVHWKPDYNLAWEGCSCDYNGYTNSTGQVNTSIYTSPLYNQNNGNCACSFPCDAPVPAGGSCGVHVVQYQKPDPSTDSYTYDVTVFDGIQKEYGEQKGISLPTGQQGTVATGLANSLTITSGAVDDDPVQFSFGDQHWDSNSGGCSVGVYDSGSRQMDCGFSC